MVTSFLNEGTHLLSIGSDNTNACFQHTFFSTQSVFRFVFKSKKEKEEEDDEMKLVVCVIVDQNLEAILLNEQTPKRGYWFPYDEVKTGETRTLAAQRIANKVIILSTFHIQFFFSDFSRFVHLTSNCYLS